MAKKLNILELFPTARATDGGNQALMHVAGIITDKYVAVRNDDLLRQLATPTAVKAFDSMEPTFTYTATATKVEKLGELDSKYGAVIPALFDVDPGMVRVTFTGLSAVIAGRDGEHLGRVLLFVDPETNTRFWVSANYEALLHAFDHAHSWVANDKRVVAIRADHDTVGHLGISVQPDQGQICGTAFLVPENATPKDVTSDEVVSGTPTAPTPPREEILATTPPEVAQPLPVEPEPTAPVVAAPHTSDTSESISDTDHCATVAPEAAAHPFGPGLDGPAPWQEDAAADAIVEAIVSPETVTAAVAAPVAVPVPAGVAPGLDLIIPSRPAVAPAAAPAPTSPFGPGLDGPAPWSVVAEPATVSTAVAAPQDPAQTVIKTAAASPLAAWAVANTVVGTDPSSTTIASEVHFVITDMRRAAATEGLPGLSPVVARALVKTTTASHYGVGITVATPLEQLGALQSRLLSLGVTDVVAQRAGSYVALTINRPLSNLVDGDNLQVLPPWVRQVVIATSVIEMADRLLEVAKAVTVGPAY